MAIEVLCIEKLVDAAELACIREPEALESHIKRTAVQALAVKLIDDASIYTREELARFNQVSYRWYLGIERNKSELEARKDEIERARMVGRQDILDKLKERSHHHQMMPCAGSYELQMELELMIRLLSPMVP